MWITTQDGRLMNLDYVWLIEDHRSDTANLSTERLLRAYGQQNAIVAKGDAAGAAYNAIVAGLAGAAPHLDLRNLRGEGAVTAMAPVAGPHAGPRSRYRGGDAT